MERQGSTTRQLIQRTPADVLPKVRGWLLAIPVGDRVVEKTIPAEDADVRASLRTRDPQEAKARQAVALAYLEGVWRSVREGPKRLTHRETVALAGEAYRTLVERTEDDTSILEGWAARAPNFRAEFGGFGRAGLKIGASDADRKRRSLEELFGPWADGLLARRGLVVDADSRHRLIEQTPTADEADARRWRRSASP